MLGLSCLGGIKVGEDVGEAQAPLVGDGGDRLLLAKALGEEPGGVLVALQQVFPHVVGAQPVPQPLPPTHAFDPGFSAGETCPASRIGAARGNETMKGVRRWGFKLTPWRRSRGGKQAGQVAGSGPRLRWTGTARSAAQTLGPPESQQTCACGMGERVHACQGLSEMLHPDKVCSGEREGKGRGQWRNSSSTSSSSNSSNLNYNKIIKIIVVIKIAIKITINK